VGVLDVTKSRELLATMLAIRSLPTTLRRMIRQHTKAVAAPEWSKALAERADSKLAHRVLVDTAVVTVSDQNVRVASATKGRPLSGGLNPKTDWAAVEFGGTKKMTTFQRKSPKGKRHSVTRNTHAQLPPFRAKGRVFYPAAEEMIPRIASLWVQTTVRTISEAFEGKQE
jgi:hypothetical protein